MVIRPIDLAWQSLGGVTDLRALGLNERQVQALALMVNEGRELTNREYRELFAITDRSALRDLTHLADLGLVRRLGEGRGVRYTAGNVGIHVVISEYLCETYHATHDMLFTFAPQIMLPMNMIFNFAPTPTRQYCP